MSLPRSGEAGDMAQEGANRVLPDTLARSNVINRLKGKLDALISQKVTMEGLKAWRRECVKEGETSPIIRALEAGTLLRACVARRDEEGLKCTELVARGLMGFTRKSSRAISSYWDILIETVKAQGLEVFTRVMTERLPEFPGYSVFAKKLTPLLGGDAELPAPAFTKAVQAIYLSESFDSMISQYATPEEVCDLLLSVEFRLIRDDSNRKIFLGPMLMNMVRMVRDSKILNAMLVTENTDNADPNDMPALFYMLVQRDNFQNPQEFSNLRIILEALEQGGQGGWGNMAAEMNRIVARDEKTIMQLLQKRIKIVNGMFRQGNHNIIPLLVFHCLYTWGIGYEILAGSVQGMINEGGIRFTRESLYAMIMAGWPADKIEAVMVQLNGAEEEGEIQPDLLERDNRGELTCLGDYRRDPEATRAGLASMIGVALSTSFNLEFYDACRAIGSPDVEEGRKALLGRVGNLTASENSRTLFDVMFENGREELMAYLVYIGIGEEVMEAVEDALSSLCLTDEATGHTILEMITARADPTVSAKEFWDRYGPGPSSGLVPFVDFNASNTLLLMLLFSDGYVTFRGDQAAAQ